MQVIALILVLSVAQAGGRPQVADDEPPLDVDCPGPTHLSDFSAAARAGERAFAQMDLLALGDARRTALQALPCLVDQVTPTVAADFHRMMAMAAFTSADETMVLEEFHAARRLEPGYTVPEAVAPEGHPLTDLYNRAASGVLDDRRLDPVIPPFGGFVLVDGAEGGVRIRGLSALLQPHDAEGTLLETRYVLAADPTPAWGPLPLELEARRRRRIALGASTAGALLLSASLGTAAVVTERQFYNTVVPDQDAELTAMQVRTNSMFWASVGAGALAASLGTVTIVLW